MSRDRSFERDEVILYDIEDMSEFLKDVGTQVEESDLLEQNDIVVCDAVRTGVAETSHVVNYSRVYGTASLDTEPSITFVLPSLRSAFSQGTNITELSHTSNITRMMPSNCPTVSSSSNQPTMSFPSGLGSYRRIFNTPSTSTHSFSNRAAQTQHRSSLFGALDHRNPYSFSNPTREQNASSTSHISNSPSKWSSPGHTSAATNMASGVSSYIRRQSIFPSYPRSSTPRGIFHTTGVRSGTNTVPRTTMQPPETVSKMSDEWLPSTSRDTTSGLATRMSGDVCHSSESQYISVSRDLTCDVEAQTFDQPGTVGQKQTTGESCESHELRLTTTNEPHTQSTDQDSTQTEVNEIHGVTHARENPLNRRHASSASGDFHRRVYKKALLINNCLDLVVDVGLSSSGNGVTTSEAVLQNEETGETEDQGVHCQARASKRRNSSESQVNVGQAYRRSAEPGSNIFQNEETEDGHVQYQASTCKGRNISPAEKNVGQSRLENTTGTSNRIFQNYKTEVENEQSQGSASKRRHTSSPQRNMEQPRKRNNVETVSSSIFQNEETDAEQDQCQCSARKARNNCPAQVNKGQPRERDVAESSSSAVQNRDMKERAQYLSNLGKRRKSCFPQVNVGAARRRYPTETSSRSLVQNEDMEEEHGQRQSTMKNRRSCCANQVNVGQPHQKSIAETGRSVVHNEQMEEEHEQSQASARRRNCSAAEVNVAQPGAGNTRETGEIFVEYEQTQRRASVNKKQNRSPAQVRVRQQCRKNSVETNNTGVLDTEEAENERAQHRASGSRRRRSSACAGNKGKRKKGVSFGDEVDHGESRLRNTLHQRIWDGSTFKVKHVDDINFTEATLSRRGSCRESMGIIENGPGPSQRYSRRRSSAVNHVRVSVARKKNPGGVSLRATEELEETGETSHQASTSQQAAEQEALDFAGEPSHAQYENAFDDVGPRCRSPHHNDEEESNTSGKYDDIFYS